MFYKFKIRDNGLEYIGTSSKQKEIPNIIFLTKDDINKLSPESIINFKSMKEV